MQRILLAIAVLAPAAAWASPRLRASDEVDALSRRKLVAVDADTSPEVVKVYGEFERALAESPAKTTHTALRALLVLWKGLGHECRHHAAKGAPAAAKGLGISKLADHKGDSLQDQRTVDRRAVVLAASEFASAWRKGKGSHDLLEKAVQMGMELWEGASDASPAATRKLTFGSGICVPPDYEAETLDLDPEVDLRRYVCPRLFSPPVPDCCFGEFSTCENLEDCEPGPTFGGKIPEPEDSEGKGVNDWAPGAKGDDCCVDEDCCPVQASEEDEDCEPFGSTVIQRIKCQPMCVEGECTECHPAASQLLLADGSSAPISEVELGALVASPSGPKPIVAFLHSDRDMVGDYLRLTTASGAAIEISPLHLLPVNGKLTDPAAVAVGAMLQTPRGPEAVVRVDKIKAAGAFHIVVEDGLYYVDGVLSSDHYDKFPVSVWPLVRASMTRRYQLGIPVVPLERGLFSLDWPWQLMTRLGVPATVQRDVLFPVTLPLAFFTSLANSVYAAAFEPSAKPAASAPSWAGNHSTGAYKHALFAGVGVKDVSRAGL